MKTDKEQAYADGCEDGRLFAYTTIEQLQELTGKQIKEIERLKKENGTLSDECITYTKEIEQLRKEKEWLIQELSYRTAKDRLKVDGEMQQALEE